MLFDVTDLTFGYENVTLLEDINLSFNEGDRIGLIGANGVGKTTFLRLLLGELVPDKGQIATKRDIRIGVLRQTDGLLGTNTVWQEMRDAFADVLQAEAKMRAIEAQLGEVSEQSPQYRALMGEHDRLDKFFSAHEGYLMDVKIKTVLGGMGFGNDYDHVIDHMSGGEKTRLALCKLLLSDLDLLVLDEPTNHLDVNTLQWLESYLQTYKGGLLIVSHDRYFLDKIVTKVWDMEGKTVTEWRGNYTRSRQIKQEVIAAQERAYNRQQEQIAQMLDYAQRNIARASTSNSAKSRLHRVEGMDKIDKPITYTKPPVFRFGIDAESNRDVLKVENLCLKIGDKVLIERLSFALSKGERLAIVGKNGTGKSTLLKTLLGLVNAQTDHYNPLPNPKSSCQVGTAKAVRQVNGAIWYGKNLSVSYYDQENLNLDENAAVLDELWFRFPAMTQTAARSKLASVLLHEEDMTKRIGSLSGGERAKLGFAVIMCENANLLFLDEPTNHLDLASRDALETALRQYEGTVVFVSHDRYLINSVATRVLELSADGARSYEGNYDAYLAAKEREKTQATTPSTPTSIAMPDPTGYRSKEDRRREAQRREAVARAEKELAQVEATIADLTDRLCGGGDYRQLADWDKQLQQAQQREEELYELLETLIED